MNNEALAMAGCASSSGSPTMASTEMKDNEAIVSVADAQSVEMKNNETIDLAATRRRLHQLEAEHALEIRRRDALLADVMAEELCAEEDAERESMKKKTRSKRRK